MRQRNPRRPATHIPTTGRCIFFDHGKDLWFAAIDGLLIDIHGFGTLEDAREALAEVK